MPPARDYTLRFPTAFRWLGIFTLLTGAAGWLLLYLRWRSAGSVSAVGVDGLLVFQVFLLPFGVGLLLWSGQRIAFVGDRIESRHFGRVRGLDRPTAHIDRSIRSGVYLEDARGGRLFVSNWLLGFENAVDELTA